MPFKTEQTAEVSLAPSYLKGGASQLKQMSGKPMTATGSRSYANPYVVKKDYRRVTHNASKAKTGFGSMGSGLAGHAKGGNTGLGNSSASSAELYAAEFTSPARPKFINAGGQYNTTSKGMRPITAVTENVRPGYVGQPARVPKLEKKEPLPGVPVMPDTPNCCRPGPRNYEWDFSRPAEFGK